MFAEVFENIELLDGAVQTLANTLANSSSEAMREIKKIFWKGTENWNELLLERAAISGRLILSNYSKKVLADFKAKTKK